MEKKHYDLIISLIKQHRKYPGHEPILEDIAQDVYERTKVVFSTITNGDVLTEYLNKVISTSFVVVPKRMNFNKRVSHRIILPNTSQTTIQEVQFKPEQTNIAVLEEPIVAENIVLHEESITELEDENIQTVTNEEVLELDEDLVQDLEESFIEESSLAEVVENVEDINNDTNPSNIKEVNKNLVDMMINGVSIHNETETEQVDINNLDELSENIDELEIIEDFSENAEELLIELSDENAENILEQENLDVLEEIEEIAELSADNTSDGCDDFVGDMPESYCLLQEETQEELSLENEEVKEETILLEGSLEENEDLTLENVNHELEFEELEETVATEEFNHCEGSLKDSSFVIPSFECFQYEPEVIDFDSDEIETDLKMIDEKHPEYKIFDICILKYKQNLSISEIAENLDLSTDCVINVLKIIVDTMGDYSLDAMSQM